MPADLDQHDPEMDMPSAETGPEVGEPAGEVIGAHGAADREGAMAKADLFKLANYSHKLYQQINDDDQLEAWVQAKITKAADYIASVYHYLEYEMKFSEYGHHLDNSDTLSEGQKMKIKELLAEAKDKMKELKKADAEKMKGKHEHKVEEGFSREQPCTECGGTGVISMPVPEATKNKVEKYKKLVKATHAAHKRMDNNHNGVPDDEEMDEGFGDTGPKEMKTGDTKKTRTGVLTKTATGVKHTNTSYHDDGDAEEKSGKGIKSHAKAKDSATKKAEKSNDIKLPKHSGNTWGMKNGEKFGQKMEEAAKLKGKQHKLDVDHDGDIEADDLADLRAGKKEKKVDESKPSAGLSKEKKSATVKKAKAGREGKDLDKVRDKYNKYDEAYNPNSVAAQHARDLEKSHVDSLKKKAEAGDEKAKAALKRHEAKKAGMRADFYARMERESIELSELAKWRDPKYKDKLYTVEPLDYTYGPDADDAYYNPRPDDDEGRKRQIGGGEFDHNDPLRKGYGRGGIGSLNTHGKRKGLPSRDQIRSLKGSIKDAHGKHPHPNLPEGSKPSAGLSKAEKSAVVKKAKAGGDIGKPGKSFDKLAKKAGGGEKGEKIAAAAMWKNIKETTAYIAEKAKAAKPDFLDMDKDGDKKEPMKKAVADKKKETVKESSDLGRLQELTGRLTRSEKPALVENREVDQIRALTKRLLG